MTVASTTSRTSYAGAGSVGPFAVPFRIFAAADLLVTQRDAADVETTLAPNTHYSLTGVGNAAAVLTLVTALPAGETLVIRRAPALLQPTSIQNQGDYFPKTHEDEFDRIVMQLLSLQDQIDRSLGVLETEDPANVLLRVRPEVGKVLAWQSSTELGNATLDSSAVALPGGGRVVASLTAYLLNNAILNVNDFGAGTGQTAAANKAAFDLAIALGWATGKEVFMPDSLYTLNPLTLPTPGVGTAGATSADPGATQNTHNRLRLRGNGNAVARYQFTSNQQFGTALKFPSAAGVDAMSAIGTLYAEPIYEFQDLQIIGPDTATPDTATSGNGLKIGFSVGGMTPVVNFKNVTVALFRGSGKAGVWLQSCEYGEFETLFTPMNAIGFKATDFFNANTLTSCKFNDCTEWGLQIITGQSNTFNSCTVQSNRLAMWLLGVDSTVFNACHIENNDPGGVTGYAVLIQSAPGQLSQGVEFNGCMFTSAYDRVRLVGEATAIVANISFNGGVSSSVTAPRISCNQYVHGLRSIGDRRMSHLSFDTGNPMNHAVEYFGMDDAPLLRVDRTSEVPMKVVDHMRVIALSAADVNLFLGSGMVVAIRDWTTGHSALVLFDLSAAAAIVVSQSAGGPFVAGAPGGGQIGLKVNGALTGLCIRADVARNNDRIYATMVGAEAEQEAVP